MTRRGKGRKWSPDEEEELYDWLLTQRLLHQAHQLEPFKVHHLDQIAADWNAPITDEDVAHALYKIDPDMNSALESWWNVTGQPGAPITFAELRERAMRETGLSG